MAKGWEPMHFQLDSNRAITTTAKAGSTSLKAAFPEQAGMHFLECVEKGLEIILIIRNPWSRLYSMYRSFADTLSPTQYIDKVLTTRNIHWSPQVEQHFIYDHAVRLENIDVWWPLSTPFPLENYKGYMPTIEHRKAELTEMFAEDLDVWGSACGC